MLLQDKIIMMIPFSTILASLTLLPTTHTSCRHLDFHKSKDCTGSTPDAFGGEMNVGCTPLRMTNTLHSASSQGYNYDFNIGVYKTEDCSGDMSQLDVECYVETDGVREKACTVAS